MNEPGDRADMRIFRGGEMAKFGNGYGSECHLLRYLGRNQEYLRSVVCGAVASATDVCWLDFPFAAGWPGNDPKSHWPDVEWKSLDFLQEENPGVVRAWKECWPHGSGVMNWDAVGQIKVDGTWEWLLVEAKSHTGEIESDCGAGDKSKRKIESVFKEVKCTLNVPQTADWLTKYYQYANRLAVLHHLDTHSVKARLLFIYFCGDVWRSPKKDCPKDRAGWDTALEKQEKHLCLAKAHPLAGRTHKVFLPVWVKP